MSLSDTVNPRQEKQVIFEVEDVESKMSSSTAHNLSFGKVNPRLVLMSGISKNCGNERKSNASNG